MIQLRPTAHDCADCGHNLDAAERYRPCPRCGSGPMCAVCLAAHREELDACDLLAERMGA